jgi:HSP20 family protein
MEVKDMKRRTPWWCKPHDDEYDNEEEEDIAKDIDKDRKDKSRKEKEGSYGRRGDDWHPTRPRFFDSPFDHDFDRIFGRSPFGFRDEFFMDIERDFADMHKRMDDIFKHAMDGKLEKPGKGGPFVYGFSMRQGPDGIPHIQQFGNVSPEMMGRFRPDRTLPSKDACALGETCTTGEIPKNLNTTGELTREPLTDIIEHDKFLSITMELPGVEKKEIDLKSHDHELEVTVDNPVRKYYKKLSLPAEIEPESITANFNNGVLEVQLKRVEPKKKTGKKIKID